MFHSLHRILSSMPWSIAAQYSDATLKNLTVRLRVMSITWISGLLIFCPITAASGVWTSLEPQRPDGLGPRPDWNPSTEQRSRGTEPSSSTRWSCSQETSSHWAIITSSCIKTPRVQRSWPLQRWLRWADGLLSVNLVWEREPASETWMEQSCFCHMTWSMSPGSWRRSSAWWSGIRPHTNWPRPSCCVCVSSSPPLTSQCWLSGGCCYRWPTSCRPSYGWVYWVISFQTIVCLSASVWIYHNVERKCNHNITRIWLKGRFTKNEHSVMIYSQKCYEFLSSVEHKKIYSEECW